MPKNVDITTISPLAVSAEDAASLIGVSRKTLQNWRTQGIGPAYLRTGDVGSRVIYRVSDLETWLDSRDRIGGDVR